VLKTTLIFILIFFDFFSKQLIFNLINLNNFIKITFFFEITHIHNYGIAFGLFSGIIPSWFFVILGIIITFLVFIIYLKSSKYIEKYGLILIIAGALSNILDRIYNGYVIDFIYLHYNQFYWPAFNFADIYISIGIFLIVFQYVRDWYK
tara:strand:- start:403 stop:849 length:447 start_codon:yes stop_codon:yes gene_type:complete